MISFNMGCPIRNLLDQRLFAPPEAYRSLSRPSSPPRAKASAMRPFTFLSILYQLD